MSILDAYPLRASRTELRAHTFRMVGTGASAPTKEVGEGITITRNSAGNYTMTFAENPGTFECWTPALGAATPADIDGHTVVRDTWNATTFALIFTLSDSADALDDLEANEYIEGVIWFRASSA